MLETNIRIVEPGVNLCFNARVAKVVTQDLSPDLLQKACGALRKRHALAAVVNSDGASLLVAAKGPVPNVVVQDEDWRLEVSDSGRTYQLRFADLGDRPLLAQLLERAMTARLEHHTKLWASTDTGSGMNLRHFRLSTTLPPISVSRSRVSKSTMSA